MDTAGGSGPGRRVAGLSRSATGLVLDWAFRPRRGRGWALDPGGSAVVHGGRWPWGLRGYVAAPVPWPSQPGARGDRGGDADGVADHRVGACASWRAGGVHPVAPPLPMADDTLIAELLGPPSAGRVLPASPVREDAEPPPAPAAEPPPAPAGRAPARPGGRAPARPGGRAPARPGGRAPPAPAAEPTEGDWLQTQLAWISAWSVRMHGQITATAAGAEPVGRETSPGERARVKRHGEQAAAPRAEARRLADHRSAVGRPGPRAAPGPCIATTVLRACHGAPAQPGDTRWRRPRQTDASIAWRAVTLSANACGPGLARIVPPDQRAGVSPELPRCC